jgi:1-acyl-sn-glycerol-3-phosphate acyltransferase
VNTSEPTLRVVAIDGVLGSGKTTVARQVAAKLGLEYLDTGAMYRCIGVACLRAGFAVGDAEALVGTAGEQLRTFATSLARSAVIEVRTETAGDQKVMLNGDDVSAAVRSPEAARAASVVATIADVRNEMVERQRSWARLRGGGVLEGRDIASVVFPQARARIFLTADVAERARRRHAEQPDQSYESVLGDLQWRDNNDQSRAVAPLSVTEGAIVVDTTGMPLVDVINKVAAIASDAFADESVTEPVVEPVVEPVSELVVQSVAEPADTQNLGPARSPVRAAPLALPIGPTKGQRRLYGAARILLASITRVYFRATWEGTENLPGSGPVIIAPVHRSNVDTIIVPILSKRRVRFLGKASMWSVKPIGQLFTALGSIKVLRGTADREAMSLCVEALRGGEPLAVFPEGTRKEGPIVEELFDGVAWLAAKAQAPIVPVGIGGSAAAMGRGDRFPKPKRVHMIVGKPIPPPPTTGRSGLKATTLTLQKELQALFDEAERKVR